MLYTINFNNSEDFLKKTPMGTLFKNCEERSYKVIEYFKENRNKVSYICIAPNFETYEIPNDFDSIRSKDVVGIVESVTKDSVNFKELNNNFTEMYENCYIAPRIVLNKLNGTFKIVCFDLYPKNRIS